MGLQGDDNTGRGPKGKLGQNRPVRLRREAQTTPYNTNPASSLHGKKSSCLLMALFLPSFCALFREPFSIASW